MVGCKKNEEKTVKTGTQAVLVRVAIAVPKHHDQSKLGRKGFIWLTLPHHSPSRKEVRTGTQAEQKRGGRS